MTIQSIVTLQMQGLQHQAIRLFAHMKTLAQVDQVFELATKLVSMTDDLDPVSSAIYESALERRSELLSAKQDKTPPRLSYFPVREKSENTRAQAATGGRDKTRWARKRRLGDMAALPAHIRDVFTEGERAVLYIVAADQREHGKCDCSHQEIADRAGVGKTTTRNAMRKAYQHGLIAVQQRPQWRGKNLPNSVKVICQSWLSWLARFRPKLGFNYSRKGVKIAPSSETIRKKRQDKKSGQPIPYPKASPLGDFYPFAQRKLAFG